MLACAAMAQQVERYLGKVEVTGSNPVSSFETLDFQGFFYVHFQKVIKKGIRYIFAYMNCLKLGEERREVLWVLFAFVI